MFDGTPRAVWVLVAAPPRLDHAFQFAPRLRFGLGGNVSRSLPSRLFLNSQCPGIRRIGSIALGIRVTSSRRYA